MIGDGNTLANVKKNDFISIRLSGLLAPILRLRTGLRDKVFARSLYFPKN